MKKLLLFAFLICAATVSAQEFEVPEGFDPEGKPKEFAKYQGDALKAVDWLIEHAPSDQPEKRQQVNAFLITWLSGSPDVTIQVNSNTLTFMDDNPQYLTVFLGGWAKYALLNKDKNALKGNVAGIESTLVFYNKHKAELGTSKNLDAYQKLKDNGKLEEDVKKKLKK